MAHVSFLDSLVFVLGFWIIVPPPSSLELFKGFLLSVAAFCWVTLLGTSLVTVNLPWWGSWVFPPLLFMALLALSHFKKHTNISIYLSIYSYI